MSGQERQAVGREPGPHAPADHQGAGVLELRPLDFAKLAGIANHAEIERRVVRNERPVRHHLQDLSEALCPGGRVAAHLRPDSVQRDIERRELKDRRSDQPAMPFAELPIGDLDQPHGAGRASRRGGLEVDSDPGTFRRILLARPDVDLWLTSAPACTSRAQSSSERRLSCRRL